MDIEKRLALSYYNIIKTISSEHNIFLVQHRETNEICVMKKLQVYNARVFQQLKEHPVRNTPQIRELYEEDGILTVVEEYISGNTLEVLLERSGAVPEEKAVLYMCSLCDILTELHTLVPPVIHRDIKPSNIMITPDDTLVLLDFNAARNYRSTGTGDTELLGTRGYAAPEQYGFGESSERTDIYAAGAALKTMLTGSEDPQVSVSGKMGEIIASCMRMEPSGRYASAARLKEELQNAGGRTSYASANTAPWRRFLPPGFRTLKPGYMIGMSICYGLFAWMAMTIEFTNCPPGFLWFERCCFGIGILFIILFSGNYLGMQGKLQRYSGRYLPVRILLVILVDAAIFCSSAIVSRLVELIIGVGSA